MIFKLFKNEEEKSIYKQIEELEKEDKLLDLSKYEIEKSEDHNIEKLIEAFRDFYDREKNSIEEFEEYFRNHKFEDIKDKFTNYLYNLEKIEENTLRGLSILLMRDTKEIETIKFGIYLSSFCNLENLPVAIKIITRLATYNEFNKVADSVLKNLNIYPLLKDVIKRNREKHNLN